MTPTATQAAANIMFLAGAMQSIATKAKTDTDFITDDTLRIEFSKEVEDEENKLQDLAESFNVDIDPTTPCTSGGLLGLFKALACAINAVNSLKTTLLGTVPDIAEIATLADAVQLAAADLITEEEEEEEDDNRSMSSAEKKTTDQQQSTSASTWSSLTSTMSSSVSSGALSQYNIFPTASSQTQADETSMINSLKLVAAAGAVLSVDWTDDDGSFHYALNAPLSPQQVESLSSRNPVSSHL